MSVFHEHGLLETPADRKTTAYCDICYDDDPKRPQSKYFCKTCDWDICARCDNLGQRIKKSDADMTDFLKEHDANATNEQKTIFTGLKLKKKTRWGLATEKWFWIERLEDENNAKTYFLLWVSGEKKMKIEEPRRFDLVSNLKLGGIVREHPTQLQLHSVDGSNSFILSAKKKDVELLDYLERVIRVIALEAVFLRLPRIPLW